jgi:RNA polymerase sigma-70 factor (ECF subfamily)
MNLFKEKSNVYDLKTKKNIEVSSDCDEVLIQKIVNRDEKALAALYHRYYAKLYRFISRMTGCTGSTEEAINDTMYVVWNRAGTFKEGNKLSTWIFGIAYNKALKSLEKGRKRRFIFGRTLDENTADASLGHVQVLETGHWLSAGLAQLSPNHRITVELSYYYGLSYKEIAEIMNCSENTAKTRMFHARKNLRVLLPQLAGQPDPKGDRHENE